MLAVADLLGVPESDHERFREGFGFSKAPGMLRSDEGEQELNALAWLDGRRTATLRSALYIVMGWLAVLATPQLVRHLSAGELALIAVGGVLFTVGAVFLATRWPDPFPRVFGYHEVWHTLVVAAAVCHLVAIGSVVQGAAVT